jgi:hypothetical protein
MIPPIVKVQQAARGRLCFFGVTTPRLISKIVPDSLMTRIDFVIKLLRHHPRISMSCGSASFFREYTLNAGLEPQFFQLIERAAALCHQMDDDIAQID